MVTEVDWDSCPDCESTNIAVNYNAAIKSAQNKCRDCGAEWQEFDEESSLI